MDFFRNDELLPVIYHDDDDEFNTNHNNFDNFWSIPGTTTATSEEDNSASDVMFVDGAHQDINYSHNGYSSSSESFSASVEEFPLLSQQFHFQQEQLQQQQSQQQFQLEQQKLHIQHQLQQQQFQLQQLQQLQQQEQQQLQLQQQLQQQEQQQLQFQQQLQQQEQLQLQLQSQEQHLQYQTHYVPVNYQQQYDPQYYSVDPAFIQTPPVNTTNTNNTTEESQQPTPVEYYPTETTIKSENYNYDDDVQYDNAYEEDDEYEEKSVNTPSSPSGNFGNMDVDSDPVDFKIPASKTPIMEAMVVCALNGWGLSVVKSFPNEVVFRVTDFDRYYRVSRAICSKHRPTEDVGSRVKTLRRWFVNFPKKKERQENPNFLLSVKPNTCKKVHGIIERNIKLMTGSKRSSR